MKKNLKKKMNNHKKKMKDSFVKKWSNQPEQSSELMV